MTYQLNETNKALATCAGLDETQTACMSDGDWRALRDRLEAKDPPDSDLRMCLKHQRLMHIRDALRASNCIAGLRHGRRIYGDELATLREQRDALEREHSRNSGIREQQRRRIVKLREERDELQVQLSASQGSDAPRVNIRQCFEDMERNTPESIKKLQRSVAKTTADMISRGHMSCASAARLLLSTAADPKPEIASCSRGGSTLTAQPPPRSCPTCHWRIALCMCRTLPETTNLKPPDPASNPDLQLTIGGRTFPVMGHNDVVFSTPCPGCGQVHDPCLKCLTT